MQVAGGRWKPLHYVLKSSTFADNLCTCTVAASCFITNDSPFAFGGTIRLRLLNTLTGNSTETARNVSLGPGATGERLQWFCAEGESGPLSSTAGRFAKHAGLIPSNRNAWNGTALLTEAGCEALCNAAAGCLGFTRVPTAGPTTTSTCWFYYSVPNLIDAIGDWYQKPDTPPIPAAPPPPPPPTPLVCTPWASTRMWGATGCDAIGSDCVLLVDVTNATGGLASTNILPFVPPKAMALPAATVTVAVEESSGGGGVAAAARRGQVEITVSTDATVALFVVLTTRAAGRFSDNVFLLERGRAKVVSFISWSPGGLDPNQLTLLKSSVRAEHLQENVF